MRIAVYTQPSMRLRGGEPRWFLNKDSQVNKLRDWIRALPGSWDWTVFVPKSPDGYHPQLSNVEGRELEWAPNAETSRYVADWKGVWGELKEWTPDVFLSQSVEQAAWIRRLQRISGIKFPIVSELIHVDPTLDGHVACSYLWRQIEGIWHSDLTVFQLEGTRQEFFDMMKRAGFRLDDSFVSRTAVWPALFSSSELDELRPLSEAPRLIGSLEPEFTICTRFSDEERTRTASALEALFELADRRGDFGIKVFDPNGSLERSLEQKIRMHGDFEIVASDRFSYLYNLWQTDVVPVLWDQTKIHSRTFCEAVATGKIVVTTGDIEGPFIKVDPDDMLSIYEGFERALDLALVERGMIGCRRFDLQREWIFENRSVEKHAETILKTFEELAG